MLPYISDGLIGSLADSLDVALAIVSSNGRIQFTNNAFCYLFASSKEELSRHTLSDLLLPLNEQLGPLSVEGNTEQYVYIARKEHFSQSKGDTPTALESKGDTISDPPEGVSESKGDTLGDSYELRCSALESSEKRERELYLVQLRQLDVASGPAGFNQRIRKQKLEMLGVFSRGIVHDLNNVLTGILGHVSFLRLSLPELSIYEDSLRTIEDGSRRAAQMCQLILEFVKGEETSLQVVDVPTVVRSGLNLLRLGLAKNVKVLVHRKGEGLCVNGHETHINQLVMNLVLNAQEALIDGGRIDVIIEEHIFEQTTSRGNLMLTPGRYVMLAVRDNGVGIPRELHDKIFRPLFTTKAKQGTGLGLSIVSAIVKAHEGQIQIVNNEGAGTTFEVFFPAVDDTASEQHPTPDEDLPKGVERVLVVDDEETVRTVIQKSLEHLGYSVETASGGHEAIESFRENKGKFDLILLDMMMPRMCGDEVFFKLKEIDETVSVLICSGYISDERASRVLTSGGVGYIKKPFSVRELALEIRRCLDTAPGFRHFRA